VNWLVHHKTLREQSVDMNETLLLRRKYFFSDQNVDARDPVQLNLLYVQVAAFCFVFSSFTELVHSVWINDMWWPVKQDIFIII